MRAGAVHVSLKTGIGQADRDREVACVRTGGAEPAYRVLMDTTKPIALTKSVRLRARVTRDLASAVSFCASRSFDLAVHPDMIHVTARGVVVHIADAPDTGFEPPEGGYSPSWSIGCVLYKMITGRAPVTLLDVDNHTEMRALVRCLGAPTLSEALALCIPALDRPQRRAKVPGASFAERIVLRETLAWDQARRMKCTAYGLVCSMDRIHEDAFF